MLEQSMRQLARHHSMDPRTMRNLVKEDLSMEAVPSGASRNKEGEMHKLLKKLKGCEPSKSGLFATKKSSLWSGCRSLQQSLLDGLAVANVDPGFCISPFSKAPLKHTVQGEVGRDG
jgi:hypothetical protein